MVRLTNPQGESKVLEEEQFNDLMFKFTESKSFKEWENQNHLIGVFVHNGKKILNRMVVQEFFFQKGYKLEKNIELKKDGKN